MADLLVNCSSCHSSFLKEFQATVFFINERTGEYYRTCSQCHIRKTNKVNEKNQAAKKNIIANIMKAFNATLTYTAKEIEDTLNNYNNI